MILVFSKDTLNWQYRISHYKKKLIAVIYTLKKKSQFQQKYLAAQLFLKSILTRNDSWAANQHIRMISEGSFVTEDRSNDAENSALQE